MKNVLDSRQLLAFCTLARCGSFTLAAKELYLTQSAVSHAMKALEQDLGCRLVDRSGKQMMLTQTGEQLLHHAERILREMHEARVGLEEISKWGHGRLRVGASTSACQYILPSVLREFKQSFPKCLIRIEPNDTPRQIELLRARQVDLAIMLAPAAQSDLAYVSLFEDELRFLVAPMHPWAKHAIAPVEELANETVVLYNKRSATFRLVLDYFREERISMANYIELGSMEAIKELVKLGLGVGVFAPWIARAEIASGALVALPMGKQPLRRQWVVAHLKGRRLALGEETFVGLCRSVVKGLAGEGDRDLVAG